MRQKTISCSESAWQEANQYRKEHQMSWDEYLTLARDVRQNNIRHEKLRVIFKAKLRGSRGERFDQDKLTTILLFVEPEIKELFEKIRRAQRKNSDEIFEEWIKAGCPTGLSKVLEAEPPVFEPLPETKGDIETEEQVSKPLKRPPKAEGPPESESWGQVFSKREIVTKYFPETVEIDGEMVTIQIVPKEGLTADATPPEQTWVERKNKWKKEKERWMIKPELLSVYPVASKAKLIEQDSQERKGKIYRYEAYFIYQLKSREDLNFLWPYRLQVTIEKLKESGPEKIEEPLKTAIFRYGSYTTFREGLRKIAEIYREIDFQ